MSRKFDIIKKKDLPDEAQITGFSFLKEPTDKDKEKNKFDFYEFSNKNEIGCMLPKRKAALAYTKGYVAVDDKKDVFIEVKSRLFIIFWILVGLLALSLCVPPILGVIGFGPNTSYDPSVDLPAIGDVDISDEQQTRPTTPPTPEGEVPTITFAGYGKYTVNSEYPSVEMKNPEGNFVDMIFTLTDEASGEIIARTNKVPAGKFAYVDVVKFYGEPGTYTVLINVATFDAQTGEQMNGINQKMEVTVE